MPDRHADPSRHRPVVASLSFQPIVPHHVVLQARNSTNTIVTQKDPSQQKNVVHQVTRLQTEAGQNSARWVGRGGANLCY
jgi:hypothetical protein